MPPQEVSSTFQAVVGVTLEAVTFVMDSVQLQFYGAQLTAYTLPSVELSGRRWSSQDDGWRDSLCARIGVAVTSVACGDERLQFGFADGSAIDISLKAEDYRGPEAFMLSIPDHNLIVA